MLRYITITCDAIPTPAGDRVKNFWPMSSPVLCNSLSYKMQIWIPYSNQKYQQMSPSCLLRLKILKYFFKNQKSCLEWMKLPRVTSHKLFPYPCVRAALHVKKGECLEVTAQGSYCWRLILYKPFLYTGSKMYWNNIKLSSVHQRIVNRLLFFSRIDAQELTQTLVNVLMVSCHQTW